MPSIITGGYIRAKAPHPGRPCAPSWKPVDIRGRKTIEKRTAPKPCSGVAAIDLYLKVFIAIDLKPIFKILKLHEGDLAFCLICITGPIDAVRDIKIHYLILSIVAI